MHVSAFKAVAPVCAVALLLVSQLLTSYASQTQDSGESPVQSGEISPVDVQTNPDKGPVYSNVLRLRPPHSRSDASGRGRDLGAEARFPFTKREASVEEEEEDGENIPVDVQRNSDGDPVYSNVLRVRPHVSESDTSGRGRDLGAEHRFPFTKSEAPVEEEEEEGEEEEEIEESLYVNAPHSGLQSSGQRPEEEVQSAPEPVYASVKRKPRSTSQDSRRAAGPTRQSSHFSPQGKSTPHRLTGSLQLARDLQPEEEEEEENVYEEIGDKLRELATEIFTPGLPQPSRQASVKEEEEEEENVYEEIGVKLRDLASEIFTLGLPQPSRQALVKEEDEDIYASPGRIPRRSNTVLFSTGPPPPHPSRSRLPPRQEQRVQTRSELGAFACRSGAPSTNESPLASRQPPLQTSAEDVYSKLGARPKGILLAACRSGAPSTNESPLASRRPPLQPWADDVYSKLGAKPKGVPLGPARATAGSPLPSPQAPLGKQETVIYARIGATHDARKAVPTTTSCPLPSSGSQRAEEHDESRRRRQGDGEAKTPQRSHISLFNKMKRVLGRNFTRKQSETAQSLNQADSPQGAESEEGSGVYENVDQSPEVIYAELKFSPENAASRP